MDLACRRRRPGSFAHAAVALAACALASCATYTDRIAEASLAASRGDYPAAVKQIDGALGVSSADQLPDSWGGDRPLAALERGVLQQALGSFAGSARDFSAAEQELELLDLGSSAVADLGSYLYSDSAKTYRSPPSERLALNAINLLNYVAQGDLSGAAVEARRFQVMRDFLDSADISAPAPATLGAYMAGFVFEYLGEGDRALRYYDEALVAGRLPSLNATIARLARYNPYRGPRLSKVLAGSTAAPESPSELLVVLCLGRVPHKVPKRIPVGAAISLGGAFLTGDLDWLKYGATKFIVYPELVETPSSIGAAALQIDGVAVTMEPLTNFAAAIRNEFEDAKPKIIAAAVTRLATRAAIAEGVRAGGKQKNNALGDILSIVVESAMVAMDKPDTRSWTMLPDRVLVARVPVDAGSHEVEVRLGTSSRSFRVDTPEAGFAAVVVTEPR